MNERLPSVIFGTSCLGNLYSSPSYEHKKEIVKACIEQTGAAAMFDSAGKYGAGMSLEVLGRCLKDLNIPPGKVRISNKLGWFRTPLIESEPTFEKGVWVNLTHDAEQRISYEGILECYHQGNALLGDYPAQYLSVHDPDEYLGSAIDEIDREKRYLEILEAYRALSELKDQGLITAIGIGSKDWTVIQRIEKDVDLDYVMIANSLTLHSHPQSLIDFVTTLAAKNIAVINSAIFNGGFLTGGDFYNYEKVDPLTQKGAILFSWRKAFFELCAHYQILPAEACFGFARRIEGVQSIALSTTRPEKVGENINMLQKHIPAAFWDELEKLEYKTI